MARFLERRESAVVLNVDGEDRGKVKDIKVCKTQAGFVKILLMLSMKILRFSMETCLSSGVSAQSFVDKWKDQVESSSTEESDSSSPDDSLNSDSSQCEASPLKTCSDVQEEMLERRCVGVFDVHISNLMAPHTTRAVRVLDHQHVGYLEESIRGGFTQTVILAGLLKDPMPEDKGFLQEPNSCSIEILGGNHTREALQSLISKSLMPKDLKVKVSIYTNLTRSLALALGYRHNQQLTEKTKPMSFLEKTALMRGLFDNNKTAWKDQLVAIFKVPNRRRLQSSFSVHLHMAEMTDDLWSLVMQASEKVKVTERFFRSLMRLTDDALIKQCLTSLLNKGVQAFKDEVKTHIQQGQVRRQTQKEKSSVSTSESSDGESEYKQLWEKLLEENISLKRTNATLERENDELNAKLEATRTSEGEVQKKKKKVDDEPVYKKGDVVEAFWREETGEEEWLEATVLFVYSSGNVKVTYKCDGTFSTLHPSWIRNIQ